MNRTALLVLVLAGCRPGAAPAPAPAAAPPVAVAPLAPDERVESPDYARWAGAATGTVVLIEEVTEVDGKKQATTSTYRLRERDDALVVEVSAPIKSPDGSQFENPPLALRRARWVAKPKAGGDPARPAGTYAAGEETVTVRGKSYKARWYKAKGHVEAGETDTQTWYSDAVPGALVKSVHRIPAAKKTVTGELVAVKLP